MHTNTREPENGKLITKYDISGEGVRRVVQESVKTQTNVAFVCDKDIYGRPVRIGYCFTSRNTGKQITPISWFSRDGVNISSKEMKGENPHPSRLDVKFNHPKKNEKHFNITFPFGRKSALFRFIFKIEKDGTENFVIIVQSKNSVNGAGNWTTSVRYDCSHGFIHKDLLSTNGHRVRKKEKLPMQDKRQAIKFVIGSLLRDVEVQIGGKEKSILKQDIDADMIKAEKSLLELFKSKEMFELFESTSVMYSEEVGSIG